MFTAKILMITPLKKIMKLKCFKDTESDTVSLKFNEKSFSADVYEDEATIITKTPFKVRKHKATLSYSGYTLYLDPMDI